MATVKSLLLSGGIAAFARKFDAVLALLAHLFFLHHKKLPSAHSELWRGANVETL
jgi:hypothetical protein